MFYYFVWVRSNRYHGSEALTYASESTLQSGQIVLVELQTESVMGLVTGPSSKPRFKTKTIKQVLDLPTIPLHLIRLGRWLQQYYPASLGVVTQQLLPAHLSPKHLRIVDDTQYSNPQVTQLPQLTAQQSEAYAAMQMTDTYLVHGTTGSGKTRLYIEMALRSVAHGNSVIVLTPEISLTSQLARNFRAVFGRRVVILHSQQGLAARQQAWLQILRAKEPLIVIGPRSALFSPVRRIGLIVLDESHEAAYKQEQAPQYQTSRVASYLSKLSHASLILGSATPPISDYYVAIQKHKTIINLNELARKSAFPETTMTVIDMKERANFVRSAYLSQPMIEAISAALARGEQSLLYLNRRGTARLVLCERCGWQSQCPHCDIPLTYHSDSFELRCHSCSYHNAVPASCPSCQYPSILFKTAGTKAIVSEVERLFPEARIARFDTDNTRKDRFEQQYERILTGDVDILIGTQLLAKGLDLPKLSMLGVLLADTSLYLPDFSASERTFQLLSQVIGRVGRGHVAGHAVIQTYHPEHSVIRAALAHDYQGFYASELTTRKLYSFPPFVHLLKLSCRRASAKSAETAATARKDAIQTDHPSVLVEGPAPSFHERFQGKYGWQLVVKSTQRSELLQIIKSMPANWSSDIDPIDLL